jgi:DNA replication and repair protein RecF
VPIQLFRAENFRCLEKVELVADPNYNLIVGLNASGKTSLLEALAYLGRGKSFRRTPTPSLVRHGQQEFVLFGKACLGDTSASIGVRNGPSGLETRVNGVSDGGTAALAENLPLQIIDPDVHNLVAGGPEERRRYLDWIAFHVEHEFLSTWRKFRRVLRQRNAALKAGGADLEAWDTEFIELGTRIDQARRAVLAVCADRLEAQGDALLGSPVRYDYRPGWSKDLQLGEALAEGLERDLQTGGTQQGPHRADLRLIFDERQARRLVSRGQQKLLACSMILAATEVAQSRRGQPMLLLLDDPAAELDQQALARLMAQVFGLGCQVVATALDPDVLKFPKTPATFHVEQGHLTRRS